MGRYRGMLLGLAVTYALLAPPPATNAAQMVSFATVAQGSHSAISQPLEIVVRAKDAWQALWRRHISGQPYPVPAPTIDFSREMVIGVFGGETDPHVQLSVLRIVQADDRLVVQVLIRQTQPGPVLIDDEVATPFHIVRLPRSPFPVSFERLIRPDIYQHSGS